MKAYPKHRKRVPNRNPRPQLLFRLLATSHSAGTIDEADGAHSIKVELPLTNGDRPIFDLTPQAAGFQEFASRCKAAYPLKVKEFVSGGSAFHASLPDGIQAVLGSHRMIPAGGARFVTVTESEARDVVAYYWRVPGSEIPDKDYAAQFKSAEVMPAKTMCSAVETYKLPTVDAGSHQAPSERSLVGIGVGRGQTVLVKLTDGRMGLIPHDDLFLRLYRLQKKAARSATSPGCQASATACLQRPI